MVITFRYLTFVAVIAAFLTLTASAGARPGDLDPTFAGTGLATVPFEDRALGFETALQPDGKVLVTGFVQTIPHPTCTIARFLPNGALDPSFGVTRPGVSEFTYVDGCAFTDIVVRPDGTILLGGHTDYDSAVFGLTAAGALDNNWSGNGHYGEDYSGGDERVTDIALLPNGRVLALTAQDAGSESSILTALTPTGAVDTSVWGSGLSYVGAGSMKRLHGLADGRVVVAGKYNSGGEAFRIARFLASGSAFDTTFGDSGHSTTTTPGGDSGLDALVVQPDGKYIVAGSGYSAGKYRGVLLRYTPEGQPDATFGSGGVVLASFRSEDYFRDVAVAPDGKIVAVGESAASISSSDTNALVTRFNPDGSLDSGFGVGGVLLDVFGKWDTSQVNDVAIGGDGKITLVGTTFDSVPFMRLTVARLIGADPVVIPLSATISSPSKKKMKAKKLKKFAGSASGDGLSKVQIAVLKKDSKLLKKKKRCLQMTSNKAKIAKYKAVKKKCAPKKWLNAAGTTAWSYKLKKTLKPGKYTLYVRSLNAIGLPQSTSTKKSFTLTK